MAIFRNRGDQPISFSAAAAVGTSGTDEEAGDRSLEGLYDVSQPAAANLFFTCLVFLELLNVTPRRAASSPLRDGKLDPPFFGCCTPVIYLALERINRRLEPALPPEAKSTGCGFIAVTPAFVCAGPCPAGAKRLGTSAFPQLTFMDHIGHHPRHGYRSTQGYKLMKGSFKHSGRQAFLLAAIGVCHRHDPAPGILNSKNSGAVVTCGI